MRAGVALMPSALQAESKRATQPVAWGELIEVPFISWFLWRHQLGTDVIAPPGAVISTPLSPSTAGPTLDHV